MKRIIVLFSVLAVVMLAACGAQPEPVTEAPTEPEPQLHTVAPTEAVAEPEWAPVDSELSLERDGQIYAQGEDFVSFALVGDGDSVKLMFELSELAAGVLSSQDDPSGFTLSLNGEAIGSAVLSSDCTELTLDGEHSYEELCELATVIRGL